MSRTDKDRIADILDACSLLNEIVAQGREAFDGSRILRSAAERQLEIIGVAADSLSDEAAHRIPGPTVSKAKAMRNFIAHTYFRVDDNAVWKTISEDVPGLVALLVEENRTPNTEPAES